MKQYALAHNLIGFGVASTLRVIVNRREGQYVWVTTADLIDAGTSLVLNASQVELTRKDTETVMRHKTGLVEFSA